MEDEKGEDEGEAEGEGDRTIRRIGRVGKSSWCRAGEQHRRDEPEYFKLRNTF